MINEKHIGILSWFHYQNFGTALQAVALKNVLESVGYCVAHINYMPDGRVLALHGLTFCWYSKKLHNLFNAVLHKALTDSEKTKRYKQFINDKNLMFSLVKSKFSNIGSSWHNLSIPCGNRVEILVEIIICQLSLPMNKKNLLRKL